VHSEPELDAQARSSHVGRIAKREREADSIFITSYRPQANIAGLTDNEEVQNWSASRDASKQQLGSCLRKAEREQSRKLRHRVNVETNHEQ